jgi:hypothetical protein
MDSHMQMFFVNLQNTRIIYPNWEHRVMRKVIQKLIQTERYARRNLLWGLAS